MARRVGAPSGEREITGPTLAPLGAFERELDLGPESTRLCWDYLPRHVRVDIASPHGFGIDKYYMRGPRHAKLSLA